MNELQQHWRRHKSYILYLLAIYVFIWGAFPQKKVFLSLIIGTILGLFNTWTLVRRVERLGQAVVLGKRMASLGMLSRMSAAALGTMFALRYPEYLSIVWIVVGLMTSYVVIMIDFFFQKNKGKER
ncbi:ATP synthase subunit I [Anoxybacillus ayderensis]|uniref:ATP synthase subunit I n=1 Tax=Anoxybacillus ayderensis TaxID=265546 RepID=UPI000A26B0E1|nr:ATP synthase subunit I [Anoxybacillus ayderensis]OSX53901.1 ATP synthase subunit [Anoxybacillus ayderensis]